MRVRDKVAIITGGGRGIGRAIAMKFSINGAKLVIADRKIELAEETVELVKSKGYEAVSAKTDVTDYFQVRDMVRTTLDVFGRIDILVNNAGWTTFGSFLETTPEYWDRIISLNLMGQVYCTSAVLDHMIGRKYGVIINIASDAGRVGYSGQVIYSAAKGGMIAFAKALAKEMGEYGIRLNSVAPGPIETPLFRAGTKKDKNFANEMMLVRSQTPMARFGKPEEVADLVLFLASEESSFITGQVISINGGSSMCG